MAAKPRLKPKRDRHEFGVVESIKDSYAPSLYKPARTILKKRDKRIKKA